MHPLFEEGVYEAIDLMNCVNGRKVLGGPAREQVEHQLDWIKAQLEEERC